MTAVIDVEQHRTDGLGASETPQALGVCPPAWGTPIGLWLEKTGRRKRAPAGEQALWGQILEPVVRGYYVEKHQVEVVVPTISQHHHELPWLRATPDGVAATFLPKLVQVKCPGLRQEIHWGTEERRELPVWYHVQAAVEMAVTRLERVDFAVLLGGQHYFEITVYRDLDLEHDVLAGAEEFWRCVQLDKAPPVDGSKEYARYLTTLLAAKSKKVVEASPDLDIAVGRWREVRDAAAQLEVEEQLIKNRIMAAAVADGARRVATSHGLIPIVESTNTQRGWEALARSYATRLGADLDADIENHTTRTQYAYPRAPAGWGKDEK